jgi:hypothetical protein
LKTRAFVDQVRERELRKRASAVASSVRIVCYLCKSAAPLVVVAALRIRRSWEQVAVFLSSMGVQESRVAALRRASPGLLVEELELEK